MSTGTRPSTSGQRTLAGLVVALLTAAVVWWSSTGGETTGVDPSSRDSPSVQQTSSPGGDAGETDGSGDGTDPDSGLPVVRVTDLPPEAAQILRLIDAGGPFDEDEDGSVFENREQLLPDEDRGYYREYTVPTPGAQTRGARRIVTGSRGELYWTDDHYSSFSSMAR